LIFHLNAEESKLVYFIQDSAVGGAIKIGYTSDLNRRHKQLETHYGRPLSVLATISGGLKKETEIHKRFAHLRLHGTNRRGRQPELFQPAADLMEFIGRPLLVGANPEAVEVLDPCRRNDLRLVRIGESVLEDIRLIATLRRISIADYLTEVVGPIAKKDLEVELARRTQVMIEEKKRKPSSER
jgi:hypothetical protein